MNEFYFTQTSSIVEKTVNNNSVNDNLTLSDIASYIGVDVNYETSEQTQDISVAIIDTGVFPHESLNGRIVAFKDFLFDKQNPYDDEGHGTQIAGIIAAFQDEEVGTGLAPFVNIVAVKALNHNLKGKSDDIIRAFSWIIENSEVYNIRVINLSVGFQDDNISELEKLIEEAYDKNIIVVSSVGNEVMQNFFSGLNSEKIILVGSVEFDKAINSFSIADYSHEILDVKCGYRPDIYTFGTNILTIDSNTTYKGNQNEKIYYKNKVTEVTGTSYSAAIVTGYICNLIREMPLLETSNVREILLDSDTYVKSKSGYDIIPVLRRK